MESTVVKSKDEITASSLALQLKWEREANKLRGTLKSSLQHDLQKLYEEKNFANVIFHASDDAKVESHSAILKARVPRFYRFCTRFGQLSQNQNKIHFQLRGVNGPELHNILRKVYTGESMENLEEDIVRRLYSSVDAAESEENGTHIDENIVAVGQHLAANGNIEIQTDMQSFALPVTVECEENVVIEETMIDACASDNESSKMAGETEDDVCNYTSSCYDLDQNVADTHSGYLTLIDSVQDGKECDLIALGADCDHQDVSSFAKEETSDIMDFDADVTEALGGYQQTENSESGDVTQTGTDSNRSDADETLMSSLKTSADLEVSEARLGATDGVLMGHSHDSGMCSDSRKLSMSSVGHPAFSPTSENAADSSESLHKDDSLECCLDSLANDEMNESAISVYGGSEMVETPSQMCLVEALTSVDSAVEQNVYQISSSLPTNGGELSTWKSVFAKRCSWLDAEDENALGGGTSAAPRRWSFSSAEVDQKGTTSGKPAAIVSPYNANIDMQLVLRNRKQSEILEDDGNVHTIPETAQTPNTRSPMSIVSFVPFLREEHHIQERNLVEINPNSGLAFSHGIVSAETTHSVVGQSEQGSANNSDEVVLGMRSSSYDFDMTSDVVSHPLADSEASTGLASGNICLTPADAVDTPAASASSEPVVAHTPPPVYMFIDAAECHSPSHSRTKSVAVRGHPKVGEVTSREVPLRRKVLGSVGLARRPKSETSVSLFSQADAVGLRKRTSSNKRVSLTLDDDDDAESTRSLEVPTTMNRLTGGSCSKLGEDLLKMFLEEIDPDVTVTVNGKEIKAHKSVLSSRCAYFAAAMSGNWVESSGSVIKMTGFSYEAIHFAIYHIYSGASAIPENIDISELASLADMLGFEGLKDVVVLALKMKYCHFFHKPCSGCSTTVSECLLIAASFGLDELQEKCLRWINKHMLKTWQTKSFAALPDELLQKSLVAAKLDINVETVLETTLRCEKLSSTLSRVKWVEPVHSLCKTLTEACALFMAENLADVIASRSFMELRTGHTWSIHSLEPSLLVAADNMSLNGACKSYVRLTAYKRLYFEAPSNDLQSPDVNEHFGLLINKIHRQVEHFLIHNANRVVRCAGWALLSLELQNRIKDAAVIVFEFGKPTAAPPRLSSQNKKFTKARTSTTSTAAGSPVWNSRSSVSSKGLSKSLHIPSDDKTLSRSGKNGAKAATLPRSYTNKTISTVRKEVDESIKDAIKSVYSTRPVTYNSSQSRLQTNVSQAANGTQRSKSNNLKERSNSVTAKAREKPLTKDLSHSSKSLIPNSISLRSSTATLSRASVTNRSKSLSTAGIRSAKSLSTGCPNINESNGKENKDDKKLVPSSSRSRMDETLKSGPKRLVHRKSLDRASSSSTLKV